MRLLKDLRINDVSSVDRGAGRGVKALLIKRDASEKHRQATEQGKRGADVVDLNAAREAAKKAIQKATDFVGAHEAIEVGEDAGQLLNEVNEAFYALNLSLCSILDDESVTDKRAEIEKTLEQFKSHLAGLGLGEHEEATEKAMTTTNAEEMKKALDAAVEKAVADALAKHQETVDRLQVELAIAKMSDKHKQYHDSLQDDDAKKKFRSLSADERDAHMDKMKKSVEESPVYKSMRAENEDLRKRLEKIEDERLLDVCKKEAIDLGLTSDTAGQVLMNVRKGKEGAVDEWTKMLAASSKELLKQRDSAQRTGKIFGEFGKSGGGAGESGATAHDQLMAKAAELKKADPKLTIEQAYASAITDPANAELAQQESRERMAKIHRAA